MYQEDIVMKIVILLRGLPASGKSSYARELLKKEPLKWKRVSRDDLRAMFDNSDFSAINEDFIRKIRDQLIVSSLRDGFNVIVDDTNLVPSTVKKLHKLVASVGDVKVIHMPFNTSVDECLKRNALREGVAKVPEKVIHSMAKSCGADRGYKLEVKETYYPALYTQIETYKVNAELIPAIICDIDGTIAHIDHRSPYDTGKCLRDTPVPCVVDMIKMFHKNGYKIIFCSGREDQYRDLTEQWLNENVGVEHLLYMRPTGHSTKDFIIKEAIFNEHISGKYNVKAVIDDRLQVCRLWHRLGLPLFRVGDPEANF